MHVGKPSKFCPVLNVHEEKMTRCEEEKYLGNILSSSGSNKANTKSRVAKGYGFAAEILSIIKEIPFGPFQIEVISKKSMKTYFARLFMLMQKSVKKFYI